MEKQRYLPCPFCGEFPTEIKSERGVWEGFIRVYHRCNVIGYIELSDWGENTDRAVKKWNTRINDK